MIIDFFILFFWCFRIISTSGIAVNPRKANRITPNGRNTFERFIYSRFAGLILFQNNITIETIRMKIMIMPIDSPSLRAFISK